MNKSGAGWPGWKRPNWGMAELVDCTRLLGWTSARFAEGVGSLRQIWRAARRVECEQSGEVANGLKKKVALASTLESFLEGDTAGDPCSPQKWVRQSLGQLQAKLASVGMLLSQTTIRRLLKQLNYSLKANRKSVATTHHPQRDLQFRYIQRVRHQFMRTGHPVISIDTKKKELIGNFKNPGQSWSRTPEAVNDHDFSKDAVVRAVPYGIYDVRHNQGYVYVGTSADTADFAVDAIERGWLRRDRARFPDERKLLILCDSGGSNGYRLRNWKLQLQLLADAYNLQIMVCHYPTGASKWNPIEHRLFSFISINWAAQPLRSLNQMTAFIRGTKTQTGLTVKASQLKGTYPTRVKVSDQQMAELNVIPRKICPQWNYVIYPRLKAA